MSELWRRFTRCLIALSYDWIGEDDDERVEQ